MSKKVSTPDSAFGSSSGSSDPVQYFENAPQQPPRSSGSGKAVRSGNPSAVWSPGWEHNSQDFILDGGKLEGPQQEHGPPINANSGPDSTRPQGEDLWWSKVRKTMQEPFSEFFATFVMILFGDGVVAQVVLSNDQKGNYQSISWGWGLGVMLAVFIGGKSGGHLNPAITFVNCLYRQFPWRKFPIYAIAQILGAFCAAGVVYGNYKSAIDAFEGVGVRTVTGANATAGIFCTYPAEFMTRTGMFFSEFIASTILVFCIFGCADEANFGAGRMMPLVLFFIIFGIGACFGWETGYAINLARDFGPRLMSYFLGYGNEVWSAGGYYFWIPMVAPFFGCAFGGFLYDVFIYTGESPINTPWMGLKRLLPSHWKRQEWSNKEMTLPS